jgi:hypothetical protein
MNNEERSDRIAVAALGIEVESEAWNGKPDRHAVAEAHKILVLVFVRVVRG